MPEDPLSDLTARQLGMIDAVAEALDRIPYDVDELVPADSPRTVIDDGGEGQAAPDEGTPDEEATQRCRAAEERRYRLVIELRRRSDEEAERRSTATVIMPACMPTCTTPPPPPPPPPPPRLELLPLELLGLLLVFLPAVEDVAACLCAARLFGSAWGGASAEVKPTPHAPRPTPHAPRPTPHAPRPAPHACTYPVGARAARGGGGRCHHAATRLGRQDEGVARVARAAAPRRKLAGAARGRHAPLRARRSLGPAVHVRRADARGAAARRARRLRRS
jgi:hypothetical protein